MQKISSSPSILTLANLNAPVAVLDTIYDSLGSPKSAPTPSSAHPTTNAPLHSAVASTSALPSSHGKKQHTRSASQDVHGLRGLSALSHAAPVIPSSFDFTVKAKDGVWSTGKTVVTKSGERSILEGPSHRRTRSDGERIEAFLQPANGMGVVVEFVMYSI